MRREVKPLRYARDAGGLARARPRQFASGLAPHKDATEQRGAPGDRTDRL